MSRFFILNLYDDIYIYRPINICIGLPLDAFRISLFEVSWSTFIPFSNRDTSLYIKLSSEEEISAKKKNKYNTEMKQIII